MNEHGALPSYGSHCDCDHTACQETVVLFINFDQLWKPANIMMGLHGICHSKLGETLIGSWAFAA